MKKLCIGLSGFKSSGKDTVANIFEKYGYIKISMADTLKDIISILFNWNRDLLQGDTLKSRLWRENQDNDFNELIGIGIFKNDTYITPRIAMQRIGTDLFRDMVNTNFWSIIMKKRINDIYNDPKYNNIKGVIIPDIRFENELDLCDINIRIIRNQTDPKDYEYINLHKSEIEHLNFKYNFIINNDYSIESLTNNIIDIINYINSL